MGERATRVPEISDKIFPFPDRYNHQHIRHESPHKDEFLLRLSAQPEEITLVNLRDMIRAERDDLRQQRRSFFEDSSNNRRLTLLSVVIQAQRTFSSHYGNPQETTEVDGMVFQRNQVSRQYNILNPFDRDEQRLSNFEEFVTNILEGNQLPAEEKERQKVSLQRYITFNRNRILARRIHPLKSESDILITLAEFQSKLDRSQADLSEDDIQRRMKEIETVLTAPDERLGKDREATDRKNAFLSHPYFQYSDYPGISISPRQQKIINNLRTDSETITFYEIAEIINAKQQDIREAFGAMTDEIMSVDEYFQGNTGLYRVPVYIYADGFRGMRHPSSTPPRITDNVFYYRKDMETIKDYLGKVDQERPEGIPKILDIMEQLAIKLAQGEKPTFEERSYGAPRIKQLIGMMEVLSLPDPMMANLQQIAATLSLVSL